jgi:CheY-like chemotaxis protein
MKQQNVRVMLASEYPEIRSSLKDIVEAGGRAVIVGQAENARKALMLARNLRPDVAIVDSYLPHISGLDSVPLSRIGGLDTAQAISDELPNARVVLLNRPDDLSLLRNYRKADFITSFCQEVEDRCIPFAIGRLPDQVVLPGGLVFAHVVTSARASSIEKTSRNIIDGAIFLGTCGLVLGGLLIITLILAAPGLVLAAAGAASLLFGLGCKLVSKILR